MCNVSVTISVSYVSAQEERNGGVVLMEDSAIIELLYNHSEDGLARLSEKYNKLLQTVVSSVLYDCGDAEECVNDTYLRIWSMIPPYKPNYLRSFICRIARGLAIDRYRYNNRSKRNSGGDVSFDELENEMSYIRFDSDSALKDDLNAFVKKLDVESQTLFMRRYFLGESVSSLASRFEMSEDNVGVKLFRIRAKLKKYLTGKGYDL